jgi:CBS domain-containing protein
MEIRDCMKRNVVSIPATASIGQAAARLASRRIGMLPVVNAIGHLVGILQLRDLLELVMPDFLKLIDDFDFVHDFGAIESYHPSPETLARPVSEVMQKPPISVEETCSLIRAFSVLLRHDLLDVPVVTADGRLAGIASRVDIGAALLSNWKTSQDKEA